MRQSLDAGYVLPDGTIVERWNLDAEHASAFVEWQKRHPTPTLHAFREWMINHHATLVDTRADR